MRIAGIVQESIVDGPGLRVAVFTQGCVHNCPGCHNPETHDTAGGREMSVQEAAEEIGRNANGMAVLDANDRIYKIICEKAKR